MTHDEEVRFCSPPCRGEIIARNPLLLSEERAPPLLPTEVSWIGERERVEIAQALLASVDERDELSEAERVKLHVAIEQSLAEVEVGQTVPFADVIASLRAKRFARAVR